jgi:7-carboxy-7-deazaguanine synthase
VSELQTLVVNEIYLSLQGETPCRTPVRVRPIDRMQPALLLCDTAYAFRRGRIDGLRNHPCRDRSPRHALSQNPPIPAGDGAGIDPVGSAPVGHRLPIVEFTGGEPLLQTRSADLMRQLCDRGYTVLVETSGAHLTSRFSIPASVGSSISKPQQQQKTHRNRLANLEHLRPTDELKLVLGSREDYGGAKQMLRSTSSRRRCPVLFSWVAPLQAHQKDPSLKTIPLPFTSISRQELVEAIVADALPVRFQLQMHKFIWSPDLRGF